MRNIEKICQWLGIVKPEQMRKGSRHEDLKGDTVALAKLVRKEGEKPGKFLLPHGIILLGWWLRIFMEDNPYGIQNQSSFRIMELSEDIIVNKKRHGHWRQDGLCRLPPAGGGEVGGSSAVRRGAG